MLLLLLLLCRAAFVRLSATTQVTYTSLLTQCARLGQADKAGIVLDELNKKRPSSSSSSRSDGRNITKNTNGRASKDSGGTTATAVVDLVDLVDPAAQSEAAANRCKDGHDEPRSRSGEATATLNSAPVSQFSAPVGKTKAGKDAAPAANVAGGSEEGVGAGGGKEAGEAWRMDRKLENDLLKLFGQADQVDAAFKVRTAAAAAATALSEVLGWVLCTGENCGEERASLGREVNMQRLAFLVVVCIS